ncbi:hypothetical protein K443DRAFT_681461 [Laccaria amethystina LaAM-08-1]|uniref:Uncharacterized protein n=1 Tax=Laccaria amethystina LaAM-08-1 TaxID=1095629 RepID=A0A0C9XIZ7_9AGAR|nr:hypothetical protein K443DRAFT_681461 [Laccaria amethystina LaAM-08-1]
MSVLSVLFLRIVPLGTYTSTTNHEHPMFNRCTSASPASFSPRVLSIVARFV